MGRLVSLRGGGGRSRGQWLLLPLPLVFRRRLLPVRLEPQHRGPAGQELPVPPQRVLEDVTRRGGGHGRGEVLRERDARGRRVASVVAAGGKGARSGGSSSGSSGRRWGRDGSRSEGGRRGNKRLRRVPRSSSSRSSSDSGIRCSCCGRRRRRRRRSGGGGRGEQGGEPPHLPLQRADRREQGRLPLVPRPALRVPARHLAPPKGVGAVPEDVLSRVVLVSRRRGRDGVVEEGGSAVAVRRRCRSRRRRHRRVEREVGVVRRLLLLFFVAVAFSFFSGTFL